jgi:hypothetical protein
MFFNRNPSAAFHNLIQQKMLFFEATFKMTFKLTIAIRNKNFEKQKL